MERGDGCARRWRRDRLTYDGQWWEVAELAPPSVLLASPAGELRRVSISHLLAVPGTRIGDALRGGAGTVRGAGLASLGSGELARATGSGGSRAGGLHRLPQRQPRIWPCPVSRGRSTRRAPASSSGIRPRQPRWGSECARCAAGRPAWSGTARPGWWMSGTCAGGHRRAGPTPAGWRWPARCWPSTLTPAPRRRISSWTGSRHGSMPGTAPGRCRCRARPGHGLCCGSSPGARSAFGGAKARREIAGRPAAPYGAAAGGHGPVSTCCWTPPGWTCSRWTR